MTNDIYEKMSEHEHQREFFSWAAAARLYGINTAKLWASEAVRTLDRPKDFFKKYGDTEDGDSRLDWMFAIPNGGTRGESAKGRAIFGSMLRAEGVRKGVSDIFLPYPTEGYHGLFIEMKKASKGRLSPQQKSFGEYIEERGYKFAVCCGYLDAICCVCDYLST